MLLNFQAIEKSSLCCIFSKAIKTFSPSHIQALTFFIFLPINERIGQTSMIAV